MTMSIIQIYCLRAADTARLLETIQSQMSTLQEVIDGHLRGDDGWHHHRAAVHAPLSSFGPTPLAASC